MAQTTAGCIESAANVVNLILNQNIWSALVFLSCGDALYDLFAGSAEDSVQSASPSYIQLSGDVGGSPVNVAVGLARLGHQAGYFTKLSSDAFGQRMRGYLSRNDVDTSLCIDTALHTTLAIVEKQADGSAQYAFYIDNTADVSLTEAELPSALPESIEVVHFGSYSTAVDPVSSSLIKLARREKSKRFISYDPNLRLSIEPDLDKWRSVFTAFSSAASFIKASDEDIDSLYGANKHEQFVSDCFSNGAGLVCMTRGPDGASGYLPDGEVCDLPGVKVDVVDTVGAGDTFQATMLHWLATEGHIGEGGSVQGRVDLKASMSLAMRAAGITCTRAGADLPRLHELQG